MRDEGRLGVLLAVLSVVLAIPGAIVDERQIDDRPGPDAATATSRSSTAPTTATTTTLPTTTTAPALVETWGQLEGSGTVRSGTEGADGSSASSEVWVEGSGQGSTWAGPGGASFSGGGTGPGAGGGTATVTPPPG